VRRLVADADDLVRPGAQRAARHLRRIEVAHGAGGRVARVGEGRFARVFALAVHPLERRARQVDLAAHLEAAGRHVAERQRDRANRAHVGGDVFPAHAVAPRRAADEPAVLVRQGDAETVDLQLGDVRHRLVSARALAHALVEGPQLGLGVRVVEAEHRARVLDGGEALGDAPAHALRGRVGDDQSGCACSSAFSSCSKASNSASEISGASST
jgi:hypothetical protein